MLSYITVPNTHIKLAYRQTTHENAKARVLFLSGFRSDMEGTKAQWLDKVCQEHQIDFVRFDYSGHGQSDQDFTDCTLNDWVRDAKTILDTLFDKPVILVGSSMGGWIALLLARDYPEKVAGLVGIAAAPDFTRRLEIETTPFKKEQLAAQGFYTMPCDYGDEFYTITKALVDSGDDNLIFAHPLSLKCPVRLLQGGQDADVPAETVMHLLEHMECKDARATILKNSDHRFSGLEERQVIFSAISEIIGR
jgi:pimeloyl-ACP methyl ester carboxylesterase